MKLFKLLILFTLTIFVQQVIAQTSVLPNGTKVPVKFSTQVNSDDKIDPQVIVASDVLDSEGNVLISAGSFVRVACSKTSAGRYNSGDGGRIVITFDYTQAVDGRRVYLSGGYEAQGKSNILGDIGFSFNGKKPKGKPAVIPTGTTYDDVITKQVYEIKVQKKSNVAKTTKVETTPIVVNNSDFSKYQKEYSGFFTGLSLNRDYSFKMIIYGQDVFSYNAEGRYMVENGKIIFQVNKCYEYDSDFGTKKNVNCGFDGNQFQGTIVQDHNSMFYSEYLDLSFVLEKEFLNISFGVPDTEPVSQIRKYDGQNVYVLGKKEVTTTSTANMRKTPHIKGKLVERYNWETLSGTASSKIPTGTKITVVGRTPEKCKVDSWEDYWYLIEVEESLPDERDYVWIYGQNITFDKGSASRKTTTTPKTTTTTKPVTNTAKPASTGKPTPAKPVPAKPATPYK